MSVTDYTSLDIYDDYIKSGGTLDKATFRELCIEFNTRAMDEIIYKGRCFNMGSRLSTIEVCKSPRNFNSPQIDWNESNKLKQEIIDAGEVPYSKDNPEGVKWFVYFTDPFYFKFHWNKTKCVVQNKSVYRFTPTRGKNGNKTKLKELLNEDSLAHLKFRKLK